jgi:hypothetical protein
MQSMREQLDRWAEQEMFEEDLRAVLKMLRPHKRERLAGWHEHRGGGRHHRVTISWDDAFAAADRDHKLAVPNMADVLESILIGSALGQDELEPRDEFEIYRDVVRELYRRIDEMESRYD